MTTISARPAESYPEALSEQQKATLLDMARSTGLDINDFLFRAAMAFQSNDERDAISSFMQQLERTAAHTSATVDDTVAFIDASNKRMHELEKIMWQDQ